MKKLFLTLILLTPLTFAEQKEPSEVKEIREIYQKTKTSLKNSQNKITAKHTKMYGKGKAVEITTTDYSFYFSSPLPHNEEKTLIFATSIFDFDETTDSSEFLFDKKENLIFAYGREKFESSVFEWRCYFKNQKLIHSKGYESGDFSIEEKCSTLQKEGNKLKNKAQNLYE